MTRSAPPALWHVLQSTHVRRVAYALTLFTVMVVSGGTLLWLLGEQEYTLWEAVYFALISATTVGYSELPDMDTHSAMRPLTSVLIVAGIGTIAFFQSTLTALLVEGVIGETFRRRRMEKKIAGLKNHFVVAGCGRTGKHIVEELAQTGREFVVVEKDKALLDRLNEEVGGGLLYVVGDATQDHTMALAGVGRANGVVAALTDDRDNLFVVLSARVHNPKARIVAKVIDGENESKMLRAGADQTVSPHRIGGLRMASELVRPKVTEFLDRMLRVRQNLRFEEVEVPSTSRFIGHALRDVPIRAETSLLVIAIHEPGEENYVYNPSPDHELLANARLIVMGEREGIQKLENLLARP